MSEFSISKRDATFDKCPECKSIGKLRRSRAKSSFEQAVKKLGLFNYYRCRECGWRGSKISLAFTRVSLTNILIYLFLMFATAVLVMFVVKKIALK
jgi:predicted RNA-binding Zn-ribbon protein involved in translation (DUF1610 family)